ncbi:hypothetical protein CAEBREN_32802 [Caenorhabditis brenneri]|uniref:Integrase catalytic domain-containing protein n=1 Tax=Caenorhabditis brenneri TaxID=135651 RepID=G0N435_CAEBE|nr:hypothetical protein CAEBREN_32802 [Caenorhabditis brenneri]
MSQNNDHQPVPPSQPFTEKALGLKIIGPFKRDASSKVSEAREWIRSCELLIEDRASDPDQPPSDEDVQLMREYLNKLHRHRRILQNVTRKLEILASNPLILKSPRSEEILQGIHDYLAKAEFQRTLNGVSNTITMFEQEFNSRGIPLDGIPQPSLSESELDFDLGGGANSKDSDGDIPKSPDSANQRFEYDEPVFAIGDDSIDVTYLQDLVKQASEIETALSSKQQSQVDPVAQTKHVEKSLSQKVDEPKTRGSSGLTIPVDHKAMSPSVRSPVISPEPSIHFIEDDVPETKPVFPSYQPKTSQQVPPEFVGEILYNFQREQAEKERENKRAQALMFKELAALRKDNHSMKLKLERSENEARARSQNSENEARKAAEPNLYHPKPEKVKRSQKPEMKEEPKKLYFTSSGSSSDGETSYDEQATSLDESEYRYATGQTKSHRSDRSKRVPHTKEYRPRKVKLDDVRRNLITFNGTGRFETFETIFNDEVMENDDIKPFMKATLLEQHLKGPASDHMYILEDPMESIRDTFHDLRQVYGHKSDKMSLHDKFNSLPFHKTDCDRMVIDVAAHRKVIKQLAEKKVDINDVCLITVFTKKLPSALSTKVVKYISKAKGGDVSFQRVLEILDEQIRLLRTSKAMLGEKKSQGLNEIEEPQASVHYANAQSRPNNHQNQQNGGGKPQSNQKSNKSSGTSGSQQGGNRKNGDPYMMTTPQPSDNLYEAGKPTPRWSLIAWSFPFGKPEKGVKCSACDGPHNAIRCPLTSSEFRKRLQTKKLCERCTLSGHSTEQCQKWLKCAYCHGDHAMGGCPQKEHYRVEIRSNAYKLPLRSKYSKDPIVIKIAGTPALPKTRFLSPKLSRQDQEYMTSIGISDFEFQTNRKQKDCHIDMILGADIISWIQSLKTTTRHVLPSGRLLETTPFGYLVHPTPKLDLLLKAIDTIGNSSTDDWEDAQTVMTLLEKSENDESIQRLIAEVAQMWNVENLGATPPKIDEAIKKETQDLLAEFMRDAKFNESGEFEVALPMNGNETRLANNYEIAVKRLSNLIVTLGKGKNLLKQYDDIIQEQIAKGIIAKVTPEMDADARRKGYLVYYIPHRVVVKMSSLTTKLRIVYDASSRKKDELSLNQCVHAGPPMLQSIFGILIRARMYKFIVIADIEKAFHQVQMQPQFRDLTRFLWLKDITKPATRDNTETLHFRKIPFGLTSSPFLLAATILFFLLRNPHKLNDMTKDNLYVDNCLYHTNDKSEIPFLVKHAKEIFDMMPMNLREFIVNDPVEMENIPEKDRASALAIKVLGYLWDSVKDTWTIKVAELVEDHPTKKDVASRLAQTFDPLGLVIPILVQFKRLMQKCWLDGIRWKDRIPKELLGEWQKVREVFQDKTLTVPRQLTVRYDYDSVRLMIFSDASKDMMAASVYVHYSFPDAPPVITLLAAKNKIKSAQNESWTIPKLELFSIEIGTNMAVTAVNEIRIPIVEACFFTDSSCAWFWIKTRKSTRQWVSNRVEAIHANSDILTKLGIEVNFRHCPTKENPADIATRGMSTSELQNCSLWFHGPEFLKKERSLWPNRFDDDVVEAEVVELQDEVLEEVLEPKPTKKSKKKVPQLKTETIMAIISIEPYVSFIPFDRTHSMRKLVSMTHTLLNFIVDSKPNYKWNSYVLSEFSKVDPKKRPVRKRQLARLLLIQEHLKECESQGLTFPSDLNPYLDEDGILRGRRSIKSSVLPIEAHEPILIHPKHRLAELIIRETHEINGHLPERYTVAALRTKYWIPTNAAIAGRLVSSCVPCKKVIGLPFPYPDSRILPSRRTEPSTPFSHCGLDYMGPIPYTKDDGSIGKSYVLVYTCLVTRGARLELVPDGSTERYIESLGIIFSRSGFPQSLYSDNARTFQLGEKIINEDVICGEVSESLTSYLASHQIDFVYITPLAPWQGGVYERVVKLVKNQLQKVLGDNTLDFHSLRRVLAGAEAMVNSRPLVAHPKRLNDMVAVRPIDFLLPGSMIDVPVNSKKFDPTRSTTEQRTRDHLERFEEVLEELWKHWSLGYLLDLREVKHKNRKCTSLRPKKGQVVLINTNLLRRQKWPLGVIVKTCKSRAGEIRSVIVKCKGKLYKRTVCQLIPLEVESYSEECSEEHSCSDAKESTDTSQVKPRPHLPSPAVFDIPQSRYAPAFFHDIHTRDSLIQLPHNSDTPIIGERIEGEEEIDYDRQHLDLEAGQVDYVDPNPTGEAFAPIPIGRTREYRPRKAKKPNVNYVHQVIVDYLSSSSSPPECCQFCPREVELANLFAL